MKNNNFIQTWEQSEHVPENQKLDKTMITEYLKPKISKVILTFNFNLLTYLLAILASIVMLSMNIYGYRSNPVMLFVETGLLALSFGFLCYGIFIFIKIREINRFTDDLKELLQKKIKFLNFHYEIWLVLTAFVVLVLIFSLNSLVDNQDGIYRINKVPFYIMVNIVILLFIYGVQKLSAFFSLSVLKGFLTDLQDSYLENTMHMERKKKKMRWIFAGLVLVLLLAVIFGVLRAKGIL